MKNPWRSAISSSRRRLRGGRQAARVAIACTKETDKGLRYTSSRDGPRRSEAATQRPRPWRGRDAPTVLCLSASIFGINYLNFALGGRQDSQLAMLSRRGARGINFNGRRSAAPVRRKAWTCCHRGAVERSGPTTAASARPNGSYVAGNDGLILDGSTQPSRMTFQYSSASMRITRTRRRPTRSGYRAAPHERPSVGAYEYRRAGSVSWRTGVVPRGRTGNVGAGRSVRPPGRSEAPQQTYARYSPGCRGTSTSGVFQKGIQCRLFRRAAFDRFSRYSSGCRRHAHPRRAASGLRFDDSRDGPWILSFNISNSTRTISF